MRRRLLLGGIAVVAGALVLFALPLASLLQGQLETAFLDGFASTVEQTATLVDEQSRTCGEVQRTLTALTREDVQVTVFDRDGTLLFAEAADIAAGTLPDGGDLVARAAQGVTASELRPAQAAAPTLVVAVPLSTTVCQDRLVLLGVADGAALQQRVRRAWLWLGLAALVAIAAGGVAARSLGGRLAAPLELLARSARQLGDGDFTARAPRSGLQEPDAIADALDQTADRLGRAVARGTAFAADASHQLRTPLTALRLQLEMAQQDGMPEQARQAAVAAALQEADRLAATIDELVALTLLDETQDPVDIGDVVRSRQAAWQARAHALGRQLDVAIAPVASRPVRPAAIGQALEVLVDNALQHGAGTVRIEVRPSAPDAPERTVELVVADQGAGITAEAQRMLDRRDRGGLPLSGGRGLPLARDLVEAEGGRLLLAVDTGGTTATIQLPDGRDDELS